MEKLIPDFLQEKLILDYGESLAEEIISGYLEEKKVTFRVNTLKTKKEVIKQNLDKEKVSYKEVEWYNEAIIIENKKESFFRELDMYKKGEIYLQNLSSMIPPIVLEPKANENILDMASAPGGKTTQIATISQNNAMITACEKNKIRLEKLKYNIEKQGARVNVIAQDARYLDEYFSFDKILLDAPCSGSGTDNIFSGKFTLELIKKSILLQEKMLEKAIKIVKKNGEIVYSTCSILKEENENLLNKMIKKYDIEIVKIDEPKRNTTNSSYDKSELFV